MTAPIRVLVVEDSLTVRKRLVEVLSARPRARGRRRGRRRQAGDRAVRAAAPRRGHARHDDAGDDRPGGHRVHHGVLPDADPRRLGLDEPRRAVQDLRRAGGRRGRRARQAARRRARRRLGGAAAPHGEARLAHQGDHPPARRGSRAMARPAPAGGRRSRGARARRRRALVAIGGSTGGPGAIVEILRGLPRGLPVADPARHPHQRAVRRRVRRVARRPVADPRPLRARRRAAPAGGRRGGPHGAAGPAPRRSSAARLRLDDGPERHSCRPSVDVLFESLAREAAARDARLPAHRHGPGRRRRAARDAARRRRDDRAGRGDVAWSSACRARRSCSARRSRCCRSQRDRPGARRGDAQRGGAP